MSISRRPFDVVDTFIADPLLSGVERGEVLEFVRMTGSTSFLEKVIQGDVLFELPAHMELITREATHRSRCRPKRSRGRERDLLDLGMEPAEELEEALDDRGIKMLPARPGARAAGEPDRRVSLSPGSTARHFWSGQPRKSPDAVFVLAHEYGHLVMDVNPYASRFCRWRRRDLENLSATMRNAARIASHGRCCFPTIWCSSVAGMSGKASIPRGGRARGRGLRCLARVALAAAGGPEADPTGDAPHRECRSATRSTSCARPNCPSAS